MNKLIREIIYSEEYKEYYSHLDVKTQTKFNYLEQMIKTQYVVNKKFVKNKNLEGTEFYEA